MNNFFFFLSFLKNQQKNFLLLNKNLDNSLIGPNLDQCISFN